MSDSVEAFITRWRPSSGSEMANFQSFANELTDLLGVDRPKPATSDGENNDYRFERPVTFTHTGRKSRGRIDLYKCGCFVLEAEQGGDRIKPQDQDQLALLTQDDTPKVRLGHGSRGTVGVGVSTAIRWIARAGAGEPTSRPQGWRWPSTLDAHEAFVVALIEASKDVTLDEMVERLSAERQVSISRSALGAWLRGRGWTSKKSPHTLWSRFGRMREVML